MAVAPAAAKSADPLNFDITEILDILRANNPETPQFENFSTWADSSKVGAVMQYLEYLQLARAYPNEVMLPSKNAEIVARIHACMPHYAEEIASYLGYWPQLPDRAELSDAVIKTAEINTEMLYKALFNRPSGWF